LKDNGYKEIFQCLGLVTQIGVTLVLFILSGTLLGRFIEKQFPLKGFLLLLCILVSVALGFIFVYRMLKTYINKK